MTKEEIYNFLAATFYQLQNNRVLAIKGVFLIAMMLIGHHRGLIHIWPIKIPIAHGLNQILGALAGLAIGVIILSLTNRVLGW